MAQNFEADLRHAPPSPSLQGTRETSGKMELMTAQLSTGYGAAMLGRAMHNAAMPVANATVSYWMEEPPFPEVNLNANALPDIADYVVIGTGLAGLAATRTLLEISRDQRTEMPLRVVALDARDVCAGATGRNGGHVKTALYRDFAAAKAQLGVEKAKDVLTFMRRHLPLLKEVGAEVPQGEVRDVDAVDMFLAEEDFEEAKRLVDDVKANVPDIEITVWPGEEARKQFGCNDFIAGALSYPAGAAFPFRLVTGAWKALVDKYPQLVLLSNTPVDSVSVAANSPQHPYAVKTSRGTVRARHVLHATNAYAPGLTPGLRNSLTGARGCMTAQGGGSRFPATHGNRSWAVVYQPGYDYVTQRPDTGDGAPGDVMVGGGFLSGTLNGVDRLGVWDDSVRDALPLAHVRGIMPTVFDPNWGDSHGGGGSLKKDWTGIMGFTGDELPFVGALPQNITRRQNSYPGAGVPGLRGSGEWIAAGFNGHGMVWAWLSGAAAGIMMAGQDGVNMTKVPGRPAGRLDSWFPRDVLALDGERLKRADLWNLGRRL